jgi:hypothetical protein
LIDYRIKNVITIHNVAINIIAIMDIVTHFLKPPDTKQVPRANATNPAIRTQVVEFTEKFSNWLDLKPFNGIKLVINADDIAPAIKSTVAERKQKTVISS